MKNTLTYGGILAGLLLLCGCGREESVEEPPRERHALVMRFFESMQKNAPADAARQGRTLLKLDTANQYLWEPIYIQEYNLAILEAQKAVNAGRFSEAEAALERGVRAVPVNRALLVEKTAVRRLADAQKAFNAMEKAVSAAAMEKSLSHAVLVVGPAPGEKVSRYFALYRQKIERRKKLEAKWQAEAEARAQAAAQAKAEAEARAKAAAQAKAEAEARAKAAAQTKAKKSAIPPAGTVKAQQDR